MKELDIIVRVSGRPIVSGDHIKISKEGRRMPDVSTMKQESENSGKGEYIEGHMYGHVNAVISRNGTSRGLPLMTELHQSPPRKPGTKQPDGDTTVVQMANLLVRCAEYMGEPIIAPLDAYFSKSSVFETASNFQMPDGAEVFMSLPVRRTTMLLSKNPFVQMCQRLAVHWIMAKRLPCVTCLTTIRTKPLKQP